MDFKQLNDEFRKLEKNAGKETSDALLNIMEFKMGEFSQKIENLESKFDHLDKSINNTNRIIGVGLVIIGILITIFQFLG